jgi:hypothetical protein
MLLLSVLASAAAAVICALVAYLVLSGYPRGNSQGSVSIGQQYRIDGFPIIPVWFVVLIYLGVPCILLCGFMWVGYLLSRRHGRGTPDRGC